MMAKASAAGMMTPRPTDTPSTAPGLALGGKTASGSVFQPTIVTPGVAPFGGDRWGDYFGSAQDPSDGSVWLIGEYGGSDNYQNRVVHVLFP